MQMPRNSRVSLFAKWAAGCLLALGLKATSSHSSHCQVAGNPMRSPGMDSQHPIPSPGSLEEGRGKSQGKSPGTKKEMIHILPLLLTSFLYNIAGLMPVALTSQEIFTILQNRQEESFGSPNLPVIAKRLPFTMPEHWGLVQGTASQASGMMKQPPPLMLGGNAPGEEKGRLRCWGKESSSILLGSIPPSDHKMVTSPHPKQVEGRWGNVTTQR